MLIMKKYMVHLDKMKELNNYIIEKLRINKDIKLFNNFDDSDQRYINIKDIIEGFLDKYYPNREDFTEYTIKIKYFGKSLGGVVWFRKMTLQEWSFKDFADNLYNYIDDNYTAEKLEKLKIKKYWVPPKDKGKGYKFMFSLIDD